MRVSPLHRVRCISELYQLRSALHRIATRVLKFPRSTLLMGSVAVWFPLQVSVHDGVQPQTIEAIQLAQHSNIPLVVAINKVGDADQ